MTVIVAVRFEEQGSGDGAPVVRGVVMASDTETTYGWRRLDCGTKLQVIAGPHRTPGIVLGTTGGVRAGQILDHYAELPDRSQASLDDDEDHRWLLREWVPKVRSAMEDHGHLETVNGVVGSGADAGVSVVLGYRGQLYELASDFSLIPAVTDPFRAEGSGGMFATGAIAALLRGDVPDRERALSVARESVRVAARFAPGVGGRVATCLLVSSDTGDEQRAETIEGL